MPGGRRSTPILTDNKKNVPPLGKSTRMAQISCCDLCCIGLNPDEKNVLKCYYCEKSFHQTCLGLDSSAFGYFKNSEEYYLCLVCAKIVKTLNQITQRIEKIEKDVSSLMGQVNQLEHSVKSIGPIGQHSGSDENMVKNIETSVQEILERDRKKIL